MTEPPTEGTVFTFYSFKGGVGRTLALVNTGIVLARWGYRVLLVDWDLEAPGLSDYVRPLYDGLQQGGVVDLLREPTLAAERWRRFLCELTLPGHEIRPVLDFLPAGGSVHDYPERVQELNVRALYDEAALGSHLETLRQEWKDEYDVVLIDSRTGINDLGGICTVQLPDILCLCLTTTEQSARGAFEIARRVVSAREAMALDRGRLLMLPLVTRFESSVEYELAKRWEDRIAEGAREILSPWVPESIETQDLLPHLRIPYIPRWSFGEGLPALDDDPQDPLSAGYAIETIAALLARDLDEPSLLVQNRALYVQGADRTGAFGARGRKLFQTDFAVYYDHRESFFATQLTNALRSTGFTAAALGAPQTLGSDEHAHAQHAVVVIGAATSRLQPVFRRLLLELVESDAPRFVVPVVLASGGRLRLPPNLQSLQWVDASDKTISEVVQAIASIVGRPPVGVVPQYASPDFDHWFGRSEVRFETLLSERPHFRERYEHGYWEVGYAFEPGPAADLTQLKQALMQSVRRETGWPEWLWADWADVRPHIVDGVIECWLAQEDGTFTGGSSSDFWRVSPEGLTFLLRGYQEDDEGPASDAPGSVLDINLPVWRMGEAFLHASSLAKALELPDPIVRLRAVWRGLSGRRLASLNSRRLISHSYTASQDSLTSEISMRIGEIDTALGQSLYELLKPLYEIFDFFELPYQLVEEELAQLRARG